MKKFSLDTKIKIKLNENGKQMYYLYNSINKIENAFMTEEILEISFKDMLTIFGTCGWSLYSQFDINSILIDGRELFLNAPIKIKLTSFGKHLYQMYIQEIISKNKNLQVYEVENAFENQLDADNYLTLSLENINMIFGKYVDADPFDDQTIEIVEKDLRYPLSFNKSYANSITQTIQSQDVPMQVYLNEKGKKLLMDYITELKLRSATYGENNDALRYSILNRLHENGTFATTIIELYEIFGVYLVEKDKDDLLNNYEKENLDFFQTKRNL